MNLLITAFSAALFAAAPEPAAPAAPPPAQQPAVVQLPWSGPTGQGVSFGYANGARGDFWEQDLRVRIPLFTFQKGIWKNGVSPIRGSPSRGGGFDLQVGGIYLLSPPSTQFVQAAGGRLELLGRTPVFLNLIRIYGGGGAEVFSSLQGSPAVVSAGGGGEFGFEFFLSRFMSFFAEIGGDSPVKLAQGVSAGSARIVGGLQFYPFSR